MKEREEGGGRNERCRTNEFHMGETVFAQQFHGVKPPHSCVWREGSGKKKKKKEGIE